MFVKIGWIIVNGRECCSATGSMFVELFLGILFFTLDSVFSPTDLHAVLGACLGGFIFGMFMFGNDKQGHSVAFVVLAVLGLLMMVGIDSWQV